MIYVWLRVAFLTWLFFPLQVLSEVEVARKWLDGKVKEQSKCVVSMGALMLEEFLDIKMVLFAFQTGRS